MNKYFLLGLATLLSFASCKMDDGGSMPNDCSPNFDHQAMFRHMADNLIIPNYQDLQGRVTLLSSRADNFTNQLNGESLHGLRMAWLEAYGVWQRVAQYEFGPAEEVFLRSSVNNFPLDTAVVNAHIQSGNHDFDLPDTYDKGFPALDYLLYGIGENDSVILEKYTTNPLAANYITYLTDLIADIKTRVDHTVAGWEGTYRDAFVQNTGTAAGSSLGLIINNLNQHYELIKREKLGVPSGVLTLGFTNPDKVEAFYSGESVRLAQVALLAAEGWYLGRGTNSVNGLGLDDLLVEVGAMKDGQLLDAAIQSQFKAAIAALNALQDPLSDAVDNNATAVQSAYNEVTKNLVNLKTDMPSVLCVSITYIDNPSDSD